MGWLDFKVNIILARLEADFSDQLPSIPAVPNRRVSCNAQPQSMLAVPNRRVSLQCPTTKYPCRAQPKSIPAVPNNRVSIFLQLICSVARKTIEGGRETLRFLGNNGFRVGMLEVNNIFDEWE